MQHYIKNTNERDRLYHKDYKRIEWASREKSRDKLNKSNGGSGI